MGYCVWYGAWRREPLKRSSSRTRAATFYVFAYIMTAEYLSMHERFQQWIQLRRRGIAAMCATT